MLSNLKVKTEGPSTSAARTISRNEKEIVSEESTDSDSLSFVSINKVFDDDLLEIKRFVGNSKPMSFTKNWYFKPTPLDMQFEERSFQTQFFVFADRIYEWNIDVFLNKKSLIKWLICLWLELLMSITIILITLKLLTFLLLVFLALFEDSGIHISQKILKNPLNMLLKRMMKVFLFLMKVLVKVFLMVLIP